MHRSGAGRPGADSARKPEVFANTSYYHTVIVFLALLDGRGFCVLHVGEATEGYTGPTKGVSPSEIFHHTSFLGYVGVFVAVASKSMRRV